MPPAPSSAYQARRRFGTRTQIVSLAAATVVVTLVFAWWPTLDLDASSLVFVRRERFWLAGHPLVDAVRDALFVLTWVAIAVLAVLLALDRPGLRRVTRLDRPRIAVVLLTFVLGPMLGVPLLKQVFERPRPTQVVQFGGRQAFIPLLRVGPACPRPCRSFPSGEAATGFAFVSLGLAAQSPALVAAGVGLGLAVGAARVVEGRHFLSDVLVSGLAMILVAVLLYRRLVATSRVPAS